MTESDDRMQCQEPDPGEVYVNGHGDSLAKASTVTPELFP